MRTRSKVAVILALVGFLGCIGSSAALASMACCTASCDPCPILVSKTVIASSPHKAVSLHALLPAAFEPIRLSRVSFHEGNFAHATTSLPPEFRSPMRN